MVNTIYKLRLVQMRFEPEKNKVKKNKVGNVIIQKQALGLNKIKIHCPSALLL